MKEDLNYNKLRLEILQDLVSQRMIECRDNRTDMIRQLKLDDEGKYVRPTTVEKCDDGFLIGIDIATQDQLVKMGHLIEKGQAKVSHYAMGRIYYTSNINILEDAVE